MWNVSCVSLLLDKMEEEGLECLNFFFEKCYFFEFLDFSDGDEEEVLVCEDLEFNFFDGLLYLLCYYKFLKEREDFFIWKEKYFFMENLF